MSSKEGAARPIAWVSDLADALVRETFEQVADVRLNRCEKMSAPLKADAITVFSAVEGAYHSELAFRAEPPLARRAARNMMGREPETREETVEYIMELFNMFCGRFLSEIYRTVGARARFSPPRHIGGDFRFSQAEEVRGEVLYYRGDHGDRAAFLWTEDALERLLTRGKNK